MKKSVGRSPLDTLEIRGLALSVHLGASKAEREKPQSVRVNVRLWLDATRAAATDSLRYTVDWAHLALRIRRVAAAKPRTLAETLASDICAVAITEDRVAEAEVSIEKDGAILPGAESLVATVRRRRPKELPPLPTAKMRARAALVRIEGALVKAVGTVYHAIFPKKRFTIPRVSPARRPAGPLQPGVIPRVVWITNFSADCTLPVWFNYLRNRRLAQSFEFRFVDDSEMDRYIRENAPARAVAAWERLENGAARADFWRVFTLMREGGVYVDMDGAFMQSLESVASGHDKILLWDRRRFSNFFMATAPGDPLFAEFFDAIVENIEQTSLDFQPPVFYVTGPGALETVLDGKTGLKYTTHTGSCVQGAFTNERFQYVDRPGSKWTRNPGFLKPAR